MPSLLGMLGPAAERPRLPEAEVARVYPRMRLQMLEATFLGYAMFYLVRNNFSPVQKDIAHALNYDAAQIGNILAMTAMCYGVGKFFLGALSDRSSSRVFMALGLLLTAVCNFAFGMSGTYEVHFWLWGLNGLVQGMGWPPCGRTMGHWFSENERGLTFSTWNTSHNLGGGIAGYLAAWAMMHFGGWQYAFYVPGAIALLGSVYIFARLRDTPQSVGLPPVEEYRKDYPAAGVNEQELGYGELLLNNVLLHKWIWLLAIANFFAYIARYSMLDWGPTYLREMKNASVIGGGFSTTMLEFGGIPSTILLGWVSDKFGGRRGMVATLCMLPILAAFAVILFSPNIAPGAASSGILYLDIAMLFVIGFFIYPVINLITIIALDLTSKKAIGTAAGFIGLFGYAGRTVMSKYFGEILKHYKDAGDAARGWEVILALIIGAGVISTALLALTWRVRPRQAESAG